MLRSRLGIAICILMIGLLGCDDYLGLGLAGGASASNSAYGRLCGATVSRPTDDSLWLCGTIDPVVVDRLIEAVRPTDQEVVVSSHGGDPTSAVKLAEFMLQKGIRLRVKYVCQSACAHFLFMAIPDVVIDGRALVTFHHTPHLLWEIFAHWGIEDEAPILAEQMSNSDRLYKARGLDLRFLYLPGLAVDMFCVGLEPNEFGGGGVGLVVKRWHSVVPVRSYLVSVRGRDVAGEWVETKQQLLEWLREMAKFDVFASQLNIEFNSGDGGVEWEDLRTQLSSVPICRTRNDLDRLKSEFLNREAVREIE